MEIEVSINQYWIATEVFAGIIAHRISEDGRYYIKLMVPGNYKRLLNFLDSHKR